ncbi:acyl-CoA thioesterase [Winogradskyella helgolandensis]|uniref:acyl-CoA thioesterase n=1 Tax=Winogradskyella helgolandensis TaxID=2697010 RepID=UPI0015CBAC65|nr:thioesterase family protein [Winogradskyella helgolandensis]
MITNTFQLQPRYGEVDQMGYVYHANYVIYCHQARNELLRKLGVDEIVLENNHIILPVISFDIKYKKPAHFDERISIKTIIREMPNTRFNFEFEITNEQNTLLITAKSTVVFADKQSRLPKRIPEFIKNKLNSEFLS